jgi:hypothetical protein
MTDYDEFIAGKRKMVGSYGFEPFEITAPLFPWQKQIVDWAIRKGRCALFEDCGLGKTAQQLEWGASGKPQDWWIGSHSDASCRRSTDST